MKQKWWDELLKHCILSKVNEDADAHLLVRVLCRLGFFSPKVFGLLIDPAVEIEKDTVFGHTFKNSGILKLPVTEEAGGDEPVTPITILSPSSVKKAANTDPSAGAPRTPARENRVRFTTPTAQSVSGARSVGVQHQPAEGAGVDVAPQGNQVGGGPAPSPSVASAAAAASPPDQVTDNDSEAMSPITDATYLVRDFVGYRLLDFVHKPPVGARLPFYFHYVNLTHAFVDWFALSTSDTEIR